MHHQGQWSASQRRQQQTHQLLTRWMFLGSLQQQALQTVVQQLLVMMVAVVQHRDWTQQQH
jgi:hypothetical protein